MADYADVITCKQFEGLSMEPWLFNEELWQDMNMLQAIYLGSLKSDIIKMACSKLVDRPLQLLDYKVGRLVGEITESIDVFEQMKVMMYDGHDENAVPYLKWLHPTNIEYPQPTEYATEISIELHYSPKCISD